MTARVLTVMVVVAGVAAGAMVLSGQGLDRAEKWMSVVGVLIGAGGAILAWLTWRRTATGDRATRRTGAASAIGPGSVANTGLLGSADAAVSETGPAQAEGGGQANTGVRE